MISPSGRVILIHGWRVGAPARSVGLLREPLERRGYEVLVPSYGRVVTFGATAVASRMLAKDLGNDLLPGDVIGSHSNGCRIAWELSYHSPVPLFAMVWIQPALEPHARPSKAKVARWLVTSSPRDWAVRLGALVPNSVWGPQGRTGYVPRRSWPWGVDADVHQLRHRGPHSPFLEKHDGPDAWAEVLHRFLLGRGDVAEPVGGEVVCGAW